MRLFVGVTDYDWYTHLSAHSGLDEVNFWSPGGTAFRVLRPGEVFLFKLKAQHNHAVVGGGIFAHDSLLPLSLAWQVFGEKNGVASLDDMRVRIGRYMSDRSRLARDPAIGCRLIQQPFFFPREQWFRVPDAYPVNAVAGKSYELHEPEGAWLYQAVERRMGAVGSAAPIHPLIPSAADQLGQRRGSPQLVLPRLGQGSFRVAILDGYGRRCAVTGERTLPIVDAAHIRPWAAGGEHQPGNGLALRTDVHRLFDLGYMTITHDRHIEVSPRLREDYENGREYYALHGRSLREPTDNRFWPAKDAIDWHHEHRWSDPGNASFT